ncbi:hypothetical protein HOY80DRAFT_1097023 [Tuber brumale]|nr:hypothetical protein HOY80DRAFT_1097023 [Tuber brumale]
MSGTMFKEIQDASGARCPDLFIFRGVDPKECAHVVEGLRHPTNYLELIHWCATNTILKVVMPSKLHECSAGWINQIIWTGLVSRTIPDVWFKTMTLTPSPEYDNFTSQYRGLRKEADLTCVPRVSSNWTTKAEFPSVVVESGWQSVANLSAWDETREDLTKLANIRDIISSVPSTVNSPQVLHENNLNQWKTPNEDKFTTSAISDQDTMEHLVHAITDRELVQSLKIVANNEQSEYIHRPDSRWLAERKVTVLSAAEPTPSTELEVTVPGILKAFNIACEKHIKGLEELKTDQLSVVEALKSTAALQLGL